MPQRALHHIRLVVCFDRMFSFFFFFLVAGWGPLESFAVEHTLLCSALLGGVFAAVEVCRYQTAGATRWNLSDDSVIQLHVFAESHLNVNSLQTTDNHSDH